MSIIILSTNTKLLLRHAGHRLLARLAAAEHVGGLRATAYNYVYIYIYIDVYT